MSMYKSENGNRKSWVGWENEAFNNGSISLEMLVK